MDKVIFKKAHDPNQDLLEMSDDDLKLHNCPSELENARKEILRLRQLVISLAKNELSESQKKILLSSGVGVEEVDSNAIYDRTLGES